MKIMFFEIDKYDNIGVYENPCYSDIKINNLYCSSYISNIKAELQFNKVNLILKIFTINNSIENKNILVSDLEL